MTSKVMAWAAVAAIFAASPALACQGKNVLFQDNFAQANPRWEIWNQTKIQAGAMQITALAGHIAPIFYKGESFDKADFCVDTIVPAVSDPKNQGLASLLFEGQTYQDFYQFFFSPAARVAGVNRLLNNKWLHPIPYRKADGIIASAGATNTLRITLNGAHGTAYINGTKFVDFLINAHEGGGFVGLEVDGGQTAPVTWNFKNFKVTDLP